MTGFWLIEIRDVSSVGSERLLDRQEVTGSIPVRPTILAAGENMYSVYVLYSNEYKKCYIGFTSDLGKRIASHNHPLNELRYSETATYSLYSCCDLCRIPYTYDLQHAT